MTAQESFKHFDAKAFLKNLTSRPGVYRMLNSAGDVIYVGKARNLKKRVSSYFGEKVLSAKTRSLVSQIQGIDVIVTHSENEALILENNLIKELKPRYNVLLRDDKSYPYIFLSSEQEFPRLAFHRGAKRTKGRYFGPFPSAASVRESLQLLQKIFPIRQCEDSFFLNRSRPCLQHQIKRCTAPCVGLIDIASYQQDVRHTVMFLEGKSQEVTEELVERMERAAQTLEYELAARYRDQITSLRRLQEKQYVSGAGGDLDVVVSISQGGIACVQVFFIRSGRNLGNKTFFPSHTQDEGAADVLAAFLPQYYLGKHVPPEVLVNQELEDSAVLADVLSAQAKRKIAIRHNVRGDRAKWVALAEQNAEKAVATQLTSKAGNRRRLEALQDKLDLEELPQRLECFDISHTHGDETVASCVIFEGGGPLKSEYRRFNIKGITPGDDYGAMHQALERRYRRLKEGEAKLPDILFIDGGKGQVGEATAVLEELQINNVPVIGVSKGEGRKPGLEMLHIAGHGASVALPADSPALHLIQQIRDEAHRFAITGHRQRRAKVHTRSQLEHIDGLGPKRRRLLLSHFGGLQEVVRAGVDDLAQVPGISKQLAQRIYDAFHLEENDTQHV